MSFIRTGFLLLVLTALFVLAGYALAGPTGIMIALAISIATNLWAYWASDSLVLAMHGAIEVTEAQAPVYYGIVRQLSQKAAIPMPRVCVLNNPQPNAFATGRNPQHAAVCATTGLLEMLTPEEVTGVLGHELTHVLNRDTLTMAMAATLAGAISMLANFSLFFGSRRDSRAPLSPLAGLLVALAAPFAAMLVQMAISRSREYEADEGGARLSGHPLWLASALRKLEASRGVPNATAEAHPATAHMFIVNPLSGRGVDNLFITHPSTENRIARLEAIARQIGEPASDAQPGGRPGSAMPGGGSEVTVGQPPPARGPWG
jgi:heat shock protein HtpX